MSNNGSIMELVAKGIQDEELIDINNQHSFFDYSIKKKNKYSKGDTIFYPVGKATWGTTVRFNIERQGDLLYGLYLVIKLPKLSIQTIDDSEINENENENDGNSNYRIKYSDFIGDVLVEKVSLYFNGQLIDEQYGDYMQLYTDLYISDWNRKAMLGMDDYINRPNLKIQSEYVYIPLNFWFCNDYKNPLPIISMQNTEIYIDVKFRNFSECYTILNNKDTDLYYLSDKQHQLVQFEEVKLQANFYYLDLEERKYMAEKEWELLITQSQIRKTEFKTTTNLEIDFNHVVKDIFFYIRPTLHKQYGEFFNFTSKTTYPEQSLYNNNNNKIDTTLWNLEPKRQLLNRARILFNGLERVGWRDAKYFYNMQNYENYQNALKTHIYMYSFNVDPTHFNNFNGCNFSRLDNAQLQVEVIQNTFSLNNNDIKYPLYDNFELVCFATNFNMLVIKNGIASVKYSN